MASPESPGRRDMSYRKPVPKYIPSPPPSPPSSPVSSFSRASLFLAPPTPDDMPPLPEDWREVITRAMAANTSTKSLAISTAGVADLAIPSSSSVVDVSRKGFPTIAVQDRSHSRVNVFPDECVSRSPTPGKSRKLYQSYRPPTPPLEAHYKRRRLPDDDGGFLSPLMSGRMIYPDIPWLNNSQDASQTCSMPSLSTSAGPSTHGDSFSTLTTNRIPSFKTEKTQCLNATPDPEISTISMTWAGALSTLNSDTDDSLNIKYHAGRSVGPMNACAERKTSQLPHLWRRVSGWIRTRLRSLSIPGTLC